MNFARTKRLTFALIAQVVFCMAFAPVVVAASQAAAAAAQESGQRNEAPHGSEAAFQAARDAANLRPDDDAERAERAATNRRRRNASRRLGRVWAQLAQRFATRTAQSDSREYLSIPAPGTPGEGQGGGRAFGDELPPPQPSPGVPGAGVKASSGLWCTACFATTGNAPSFACAALVQRITAIQEDRCEPAPQVSSDCPTRTILIASVQPTGPPRP